MLRNVVMQSCLGNTLPDLLLMGGNFHFPSRIGTKRPSSMPTSSATRSFSA